MSPDPQRRSPRPGPVNLERLALLGGSGVLTLLLLLGMGAPRNWWTRTVELRFRTYSAAGLSPGMPVMISGYPVGRVRHIRLLNDAQVQVSLSVGAEQEAMIGRRSRARLAQDNLLGKAYIAISPDLSDLGHADIASREHTLIYETDPSLGFLIRDLAASRIPLQQVISNTAKLMNKRLPRSLDQLDRTLVSGQRLAGSIERELVGGSGSLQSSVSNATGNLETTLSSVQSTLAEIQTLARSSNTLLQSISRSWLLQLLQPAPPLNPAPGQPAPPPPQAGPDPGASR